MNFRPVDTTQVMTLREVADFLHVHYTTVYRLVHRGQLPGAFRIGADWRFMRRELERWMREPRRPSRELSR